MMKRFHANVDSIVSLNVVLWKGREVTRGIVALVVLCSCFIVSGCAAQKGSLLLEPKSKQQFALMKKEDSEGFVKRELRLIPSLMTLTKDNVEITVESISREYLDDFFADEDIFGPKPKPNPYPLEAFVLYIKIKNNRETKINLNPDEFVLVDDTNSQYQFLSPEYLIALYGKGTVSQVSETGSKVAPGIYGAPFNIANVVASGPLRERFVLLKQVTLTGGYVYGGIVYDGYAAFYRPSQNAKTIQLILPNIKTEFDTLSEPSNSVDFDFEFTVSRSGE